MEGKTFIFVVLSGLCFLPASFPRVYVLVEKAKTWAEARSYCLGKYTDLASVVNKEESDQLVATAIRYYNGHVWIGLYNDINKWTWSLEKEGYYGEGEFRLWKIGEPNNAGGYENCALMNSDGSWNDAPCSLKVQFVCYNETLASSSFVLVNESKTWSEAQSYCREHYTDLASVRNQTENEKIKKMTHHQYIWIGLYKGSWKWSDGSTISFTNWNPDTQQNGNPSGILHLGRWEGRRSDDNLYFVCQTVQMKQQVLRVKVTKKDSPVNLEDATEAILQQFSQTLKEHGQSEYMKLTWRMQPDGKIFYLEEKEGRKDNDQTTNISCNLK